MAVFPGFRAFDLPGAEPGISIHGVTGGSGPPLLLLHGNPQTHAMWGKVAPALAERFTLVATDLRGYGRSSKPNTDADHSPYSKRAMAADMVAVMGALGFERFRVGSHDRGARVAHRLALDHPDRVVRLAMLDIAPTREMYRGTDETFARDYWHWFFMIQPAPLPERMISADPDGFWHWRCARPPHGLSIFDPEALEDYLTAFRDPKTVQASCEDYRASAGIDIRHDDADGDARITCPVLVLWAATGTVGRCFDVLSLWRQRAERVEGSSLPGGHYLAEELPGEVTDHFLDFFAAEDV